MADSIEFDSRPNQIPKDIQGSDSSIPLSPQWLLPKSGENKTGSVTGENHFSRHPGYADRPEAMKPSERGDNSVDNHKKDVFRPSVLDSGTGRRDGWREEERDTNSSGRKDRWRDGDREQIDSRRVDRKVDSSGRQFGRPSEERWTDSGNRDNRESKWNTRWGPDHKESNPVREKWGDSNKGDDVVLDKGFPNNPYHGKDERDGNHYRPWRPLSSYSRGRGDSQHQSSILNKQAPSFSHGRGRGEHFASNYTLGRGRVSLGVGSVKHGPVLEKVENGEPYYNRPELIDIYRTINMTNHAKYLEGVVQVPSLTQEEPVEPVSLCAPSPEELVVLKEIENGEITSSGAPQVSKDGSAGRTPTGFMQLKRNRHGSKDDLPSSLDDSKPDTMNNPEGYSDYSERLSYEKQNNSWPSEKIETMEEYEAFPDHKLNGEALREDRSAVRESRTPGHSSVHHIGPWRSPSFREHSRFTSDRREVDDDPFMRRQPSLPIDREREPHNVSQSSPGELVLYYKDPQGIIQGPFAGSDIITWFESGYFGLELQVRLASEPAETPYSLLGDVMPHLRPKARPPPGFSSPVANEVQDLSGRSNFNNHGNLHAVSSEADVLINDPRYKLGSTVVAENRFLESLMADSGNTVSLEKFALSEGTQGYGGQYPFAQHPLVSNSGEDPYSLAKKLSLERQRSLTNPSNLPSPIPDNARAQHYSQNMGSSLQGFSDATSAANNGMTGWLNQSQNLDIPQSQNFPLQSAFGIQQQMLQQQNAPLIMLTQPVDNLSKILTPEKLLNSNIPQDPQLLSLLQQHYLQQLQPQAPQHLTLLDMLMLKEKQKQEEQQQLMRQQQQLLSKLLSEQHLNQRMGDTSFAQSGGFAAGNPIVDHTRFQQSHDLFQIPSQLQASIPQHEKGDATTFVFPQSDSQEIKPNIVSETSLHLPHHVFANNVNQRNWAAPLQEQIVEQETNFSSTDRLASAENANKYATEQISNYNESVRVSTTDSAPSFPAGEYLGESVSSEKSVTVENEVIFDEALDVLVETSVKGAVKPQDVEQHVADSSSLKEVKNSEAREVKNKKSKKQKSSKISSDTVTRKSQEKKLSEIEGTNSGNVKSASLAVDTEILTPSVSEKEKRKTTEAANDVGCPSEQKTFTAFNDADDSLTTEKKVQPGQAAYASQVNTFAGQHAWKPAPGFKPKSFLEIQQEEQRRAQEEQRRAQEEAAVSEISKSVSSMSVATPWAGLVVNADHKASSAVQEDSLNNEQKYAKSDNSAILKKSQKEDVFWDNNETGVSDLATGVSLTSIMSSQTNLVAGDDFIDAKDTKKSRKKSKAKNAGPKIAPLASVDASLGSSPTDKGKLVRQMQQQKEVAPSVPSGPSLGDFVNWKGESASSPALAWSTEPTKPHKAASLRDILKEQERKVSPSVQVPTPNKSTANQPARGNGPLWSISSTSAKSAPPVPINSQAAHINNNDDDDLFWGSSEQPKPEDTKSGFPQLRNQGSWGSKTTPVKGGSLNQQKSNGGTAPDYSLSASKSSLKGKKNASTKHSEAVDFKEWCESECTRLVGSKDTSILEYCLKISRSEAEMLLIENLGSVDANHVFIDKFLNYKDFLPADVFEIASKGRNDRKTSASDMTSDHGVEVEEATKGGGKKKGKKGKKVSPSVLGFNVVSNRIMMGEIQTVEDH